MAAKTGAKLAARSIQKAEAKTNRNRVNRERKTDARFAGWKSSRPQTA